MLELAVPLLEPLEVALAPPAPPEPSLPPAAPLLPVPLPPSPDGVLDAAVPDVDLAPDDEFE